MRIQSRKSWRARDPRPGMARQADSIITEFFLHHPADPHNLSHLDTDGEQDAFMRGVQNFHMDDPQHHWNDIGYAFVVFQDGRVYRGRGRGHVPAAQLDHNTGTIAVLCAVGNGEAPTPAMVRGLGALKDEMDKRVGRDLRVRAHGDVTPTECPGPQVRAIIPQLNRTH